MIPRSDYSEETRNEMMYALRHLHSAIQSHATECVGQDLRTRNYDRCFEAVEEYFADTLPQSRAVDWGKSNQRSRSFCPNEIGVASMRASVALMQWQMP